jgi:DNA-directed RNA polymerase subunit N (RpoN/RPB10)
MLSGGGNGSSAAPFIKPNRRQRREAERRERKKRNQSFGRKRDIPTEEVRHVLERCPDCGRRLSGGWEHSRRQVIEIPRTPARIIEHVLIARRCGVCQKVHIPKLTIADGVVGRMRLGVNLMSLIATLSVAKRMPQRTIQRFLDGLYGLHISVGEISEVLHRVSQWSKPTVGQILTSIRGSPDASSDETGWREDGINGYLWSVSTRTARFYYFHRRRSSRIIRHILGGKFVCQRPPACAPPMVGSCAPPRMCVSRCSRLLSGGLRDRFLLGVGLLSFGWARGVFAGPLPVAFAGYDGHSGVVCESVEGCGGQERIPEYLRPLGG